MSDAAILNGLPLRDELVAQARRIMAEAEITPQVRVFGVDHADPRAGLNVSLHRRFFEHIGFEVEATLLPQESAEADVLRLIEEANADPTVDVIMPLLPLPDGIDIRRILAALDPGKEIEGLHPRHAAENLPLSLPAERRVGPVVPEAVLTLLAHVHAELDMASVVVLTDPALTGRNPVSRAITGLGTLGALPATAMATVVPVTHARAREACAMADLLLVSVEQPLVVTEEWVKPGAVVIDFNAMINCKDRPGCPTGPVIGGVYTEAAARRAGLVAGIPGGFGPVLLGTVARRIARHAAERRASTTA